MRIAVRIVKNVAVLDMEGNIDINASDFIEAVGSVLRDGVREIVCNFEDINLVDYVGVSIIAIVYKNILNHEGAMKLCNLPSHVAKLFAMVGLDKVFCYYMDEDAAVKAVEEERGDAASAKENLRRRFKRVDMNMPIEYKQASAVEEEFLHGKIINLSAEGIFLTVSRVFSPGTVLIVRMNLYPAPGPVSVQTRVVWVAQEGYTQTKENQAMGLAFLDLTTKEQDDVIQFLERHISGFTR